MYEDIEKELIYYKDCFKDKTVYCNCDDPYQSNFFKYFIINFNNLKLKKLICTCYAKRQVKVNLFDVAERPNNSLSNYPYKVEIVRQITDYDGDGVITSNDVELFLKDKNNNITILKEDGDFRSCECVELLKESDIVVTNPPFSLFREYVTQLITYNKNFIILGNMNAITYKNIFFLFKNNKIWIGYKNINEDMYFNVTDEYKQYLLKYKKNGFAYRIINGVVMFRGAFCCWFTNLDHLKRHNKLNLTCTYVPEKYPKYDNYDAINVNSVDDIPCDYYGLMGVPITFFGKYNPEQFEIVGHEHDLNGDGGKGIPNGQFEINGKGVYSRILIRKKAHK